MAQGLVAASCRTKPSPSGMPIVPARVEDLPRLRGHVRTIPGRVRAQITQAASAITSSDHQG